MSFQSIAKGISAVINRVTEQTVKKRIAFWSHMLDFVISILVLAAMVIDYGFELDSLEMSQIGLLYRIAWWYYVIAFSADLVFNRFRVNREKIVLTLLMGLMLYASVLMGLLPPDGLWPWVGTLRAWLLTPVYLQIVVGVFAVVDASRAILSFISSKTNPALLMAATFAVIIFVGTVLLMVPRSTVDGYRIPVVDALFVSTSAVCVTGLSPVDVGTTFTLEGQIILLCLIQIGGLGVMTITSFFAMFFMGSTGFGNQFALRDMVGSDTFSSLMSTLLYILGFTFSIELAGALFIWIDIHGTLGMTFHEELFFSIFHAVSAFCNAGFSTYTGNLGNEALFSSHLPFYWVISFLVILGGIGYPILVNFKQVIFYQAGALLNGLKRKPAARPKLKHLTSLNSKIVLGTTLFLLVGGTVAFACLEWHHSMAGMSGWQKLTHAFFNSAVTRTAGFNSVDLTRFSLLSLIIYMVLMWIGGASQSTAGGIKVNTITVAIANFVSVLRGRECVVLFGREISAQSVRRTFATITGSLVVVACSFMLLVSIEPQVEPLGLLFEVVSALGTVGSSLNVTPLLGNDGKLVIAGLMFVGRVGLITVLASLIKPVGTRKYRYPKGEVIIN